MKLSSCVQKESWTKVRALILAGRFRDGVCLKMDGYNGGPLGGMAVVVCRRRVRIMGTEQGGREKGEVISGS